MKPSRVNRAVSRVRTAGKHPGHTERATFRSCVIQTVILRDGRCCFCSPLPCHLPCVITTSFTAVPHKGYSANLPILLLLSSSGVCVAAERICAAAPICSVATQPPYLQLTLLTAPLYRVPRVAEPMVFMEL